MKLFKIIELKLKRLLYFFLSLIFRNKNVTFPIDSKKIKKILILRFDAIGDMIVTLPVVEILKTLLPKTEVHILASSRNAGLLRNDNRFSKVFVWDGTYKSFIKNILKMRKEKFDFIFSTVMSKTTLSGMFANLIGGKNAIKATIKHEERADLYSTFFNIQISVSQLRNKVTMSEILSYTICTVFGWEYVKNLVKIHLYKTEKNITKADNFIRNISNKKNIILNISSGNSYRKLRKEKNIEILNQITNFLPDFRVIILAAPGDERDAEFISSNFKGKAYVFPPTKDLLDIAAIIENADYVITPDTSIIHFCSAVKKPVLVLYSLMSSYIKEWMPFDCKYRVVITNGRQPLDTLDTKEIFAEFINLIKDSES